MSVDARLARLVLARQGLSYWVRRARQGERLLEELGGVHDARAIACIAAELEARHPPASVAEEDALVGVVRTRRAEWRAEHGSAFLDALLPQLERYRRSDLDELADELRLALALVRRWRREDG